MTIYTLLIKGNKVNRSRAGTGILFLALLFFALFMVLPMILVIGNSFKPLDELWVFPPRLFPVSPTLRNYKNIFSVMSNSWIPFSRYLFNTVALTAVGTLGNIIFASLCAYPLAKKQFIGKNIIFSIIVMTLMFNGVVTAIPNYLTMSALGWINNPLSLIIPAFASPISLYIMKQFMEQIPDSIIEACRVDGASQWKTFWKIIMPNVKPAWLTLMLFSVQGLWGLGSSTYIFSEQYKTLSYALSQIMTGGIARAGVGAAVSVLTMSVPIAIFIFTQSNIIQTMTSSGMKD